MPLPATPTDEAADADNPTTYHVRLPASATAVLPLGTTSHTLTLAPATLVAGPNVLAVAVHPHRSAPAAADTILLDAVLDVTTDQVVDSQAAQLAGVDTIVRGPYMTALTSRTVTVRWRTEAPCVARVWVHARPSNVARDGTPFVDASTSASTDHTVVLMHLNPDARYYYALGTTITATASLSRDDLTFRTLPTAQRAATRRLWLLGDPGTGRDDQIAVRDAAVQFFTRSTWPDLMFVLGDNAYESATDPELQANLFTPYKDMMRKTPVVAVYGCVLPGGVLCACVCMCARVCVRVYVCACVCVPV